MHWYCKVFVCIKMKRRIGFKDHTYIFKALFRACIKILFLLCIFVHPYGIKTVHAGGGAGGQKMAKFYPRSCWLPPNARSWSCLLLLLTPCWSVFFEKSSSTNWIFSLQKSISKLIFLHTQAVKIQFEIG